MVGHTAYKRYRRDQMIYCIENLNATELVISKPYSAGIMGIFRSSANIKFSLVSNMALMLLFFNLKSYCSNFITNATC